MLTALIDASSDLVVGQHVAHRAVRDRIAMRDDVMNATDQLKNWMFEHVYTVNSSDEEPRVYHVIHKLFDYFMENPGKMRGTICPLPSGEWEELETTVRARCVCDYIAGMTDR